MALLMFRTFGVIIVSFIVLIMYVLHRKKNGKFIKRKAVNEEEKIKYPLNRYIKQLSGTFIHYLFK